MARVRRTWTGGQGGDGRLRPLVADSTCPTFFTCPTFSCTVVICLLVAACQQEQRTVGANNVVSEPPEFGANHEEVTRQIEHAAAARQQGDAMRARDLLREAIRLDPGSGQAHHDLGLAYYELGDLYNAALHLDTASRLLRDRVEPCYNLGLVLEMGGRYELARQAYERGLQREPDHLASMENLARVRIKSGLWDRQTVELVEACLAREVRPDWTEWLNRQLTRLRERLGRVGEGDEHVAARRWQTPTPGARGDSNADQGSSTDVNGRRAER